MSPFAAVATERIYTFNQVWKGVCESEGRWVPLSTFRDWISKACLLHIKDEYTQDEVDWLNEWLAFKARYPRRSTVKVKRFHEYMRKQQCPN